MNKQITVFFLFFFLQIAMTFFLILLTNLQNSSYTNTPTTRQNGQISCSKSHKVNLTPSLQH